MTALLKARLAEITAGENPTEVPDSSVSVQFNPTSLRVQIANRTAGGAQAGAQARQRPGTGEMTVAFDLVFDTADEGGDVMALTASVERFVRPKGNRAGQEAPPRVLFEWGSFLVQGTMESANLDLDFFDAGGIPLRAKVAVSIKGQDPRWTYQPAPPAGPANPASNPQAGSPSLPPGAPGTQGSNRSPERVVQAMPGESLAQLAARVGLDPAAWRALAGGLSNPLQLSLRQEIALPPGLGQGSASGQKAQGQDPGRSTAALPLVNAASASGGSSGSASSHAATGSSGAGGSGNRANTDTAVRQGQAVASQGGLGSAITQAKGQMHQARARQSLTAFGVGSGDVATADVQDRPWGAGVPLRPRFGSGQRANASLPASTRMALGSPIARPANGGSSTGTAGATGSSSGTASKNTRRSQATPVSKGCGCQGRRSRPAR